MSHTSQRRGLDPARPGQELVILAMIPRAYARRKGIKRAMADLGRRIMEHQPNNWIFQDITEVTIPQFGHGQKLVEWLHKRWPRFAERLVMFFTARNSTVITATYTDMASVRALIKDLKETWAPQNRRNEHPISIVLSGLAGDVRACCQEAGLREHTYLHSLGIFGTVEDLPSEDELALITMCGHGLVSTSRIRNLVERIRKGRLTAREAAEDVALPCVCGVVNKERAEEVFARLAAAGKAESRPHAA